jgi:hypothetical protein
VSAIDNANKKRAVQAQLALDRSVAWARDKTLEFAYRARPCLSPERQAVLRAITGDDDPEVVLVAEYWLLMEESLDLFTLELRAPAPLPLITRMGFLGIRVTNELARLRHAQAMFDIKRRRAGNGGAAAEQARDNSESLRPASVTTTANGVTNNSSPRRCANGQAAPPVR